MTLFLLFVIVAGVWSMVRTVHALVRDDRGYRPPPGSHQVDPAFLPPAALFSRR